MGSRKRRRARVRPAAPGTTPTPAPHPLRHHTHPAPHPPRQKRVLVVGAGVSGALAVWFLRRRWSATATGTTEQPSAASSPPLHISVWDGARGAGGRLATARIQSACGSHVLRANMGAQRLHFAPATDTAARAAAEFLVERNVVDFTKTCGDPHHANTIKEMVFTGPSNDVCKALLEEADAIRYQARIRAIRIEGNQVVAEAFGDKKGGSPHVFDAMIFAGSVPEVFTTHGDLDRLVAPIRGSLKKIQYTKTCCIALSFPPPWSDRVRTAVAGGSSVANGQHFNNADIAELALQPEQGGQPVGELVVLAVSTDEFGKKQTSGLRATHRPSPQDLAAQDRCCEALVASACEVLAGLAGMPPCSPAALVQAVSNSKLNFWKHARVRDRLRPPRECFEASTAPPIVLCGDYFVRSTFGGACASASAAATAVAQNLTGSSSSLPRPRPPPLKPRARVQRRLLVVGAGLSGALCAHLIRTKCGSLVHLTVMDMARGAGGRMSTTRWSPKGEDPYQDRSLGGPKGTVLRANTGAQYVSVRPGGAAMGLCEVMSRAGLLQKTGDLPSDASLGSRDGTTANNKATSDPRTHVHTTQTLMESISTMAAGSGSVAVEPHSRCFSGGHVDYATAEDGTSGVVRWLLSAADETVFESRLSGLIRRDDQRWAITLGGGGDGNRNDGLNRGRGGREAQTEGYDAVIIAMPPKDAMRAAGSLLNKAVQSQLRQVQWTSRFSLALWWSPSDARAKAFVTAAVEGARRASRSSGVEHSAVVDAVVAQSASVVVVQSTAQYWTGRSGTHAGGGLGGGKQATGASAGAFAKIKGSGRQLVLRELTAELQRLAGGIPMPEPGHVKLLNWRTSQVKAGTVGPKSGYLLASSEPPLLLTGDWAGGESSFDACFSAADGVANCIARLFPGGSLHAKVPGPSNS